jgi:hypothetical protein
MAFLIPVQQLPTEKIGDFNKRLQGACMQEDDQDQPITITDATLTVVDGLPLVLLTAEMTEATEEDVENDEPEEGQPRLKEGDLIPAGPGLIVQVMGLDATTDERASKSQGRLNSLATRFGGEVLHTSTAVGTVIALVDVHEGDAKDPSKVVKKQVPVRKDVTFLMVAYDLDTWDQSDQSTEDIKKTISGKR